MKIFRLWGLVAITLVLVLATNACALLEAESLLIQSGEEQAGGFGLRAVERGGLLCATEGGNCVESWNGSDVVVYSDTGSTRKYLVDGATGNVTMGSGAAADNSIVWDGNAQDFYIALDDSADDLLIGLGSTVGTTPALGIDENLAVTTYGDFTFGGTTPVLTIGDAGAEDAALVYDGNAQDFYVALDDSADDLILGLGSTVGTTGIVYLDENQDVGLGGASAGAKLDITGNMLIDGAADEVQITVQGNVTQTSASLVVEDSSGTDVFVVAEAPAAGSGGDLLDITDTTAAMDGSDTIIGIDVNITGANHTGSSNAIHGIDLDLTTADADADEIAIELSDTDWDTGIKGALGLEHIGLPTMASQTITYTAAAGGSGTLWTVSDGEIWHVHAVFAQVTTNWDATGDDALVNIGDGNDADGLLDLDDAELQTADTEGTGAPAGWQGFMSTDTRGAYLANGHGFIYAPSGADETIDYAIDETSGETLAAGQLTVYIIYTRLQ